MKGREIPPEYGSAQEKRVKSAVRSLLRLTPAGDAARIWSSMAMAFLMLAFVFFVVGGSTQPVYWLLAVNVVYGLFLLLTWGAMWTSTPADVQRWAIAQERSRHSRWGRFVEIISDRRVFSGGMGMIFIISVSFGGLLLALGLLPQGGLGSEPLQALLCVLGVLLSWALLHTSYAMYYAHLYYRIPGRPGGVEFPGESEPAALDFTYFAFTVGTSFATSDVSISSARVRPTVLAHSVLAFFYNTTILALVVNFITSA